MGGESGVWGVERIMGKENRVAGWAVAATNRPPACLLARHGTGLLSEPGKGGPVKGFDVGRKEASPGAIVCQSLCLSGLPLQRGRQCHRARSHPARMFVFVCVPAIAPAPLYC